MSGLATTVNWPSFCLGLCLLALGLVLLYCSLLWTLLCVMLRFIIGRSLAPRPCLTLAAPCSISRRSILGYPLFVLLAQNCCCLQKNWTIRFGVLDHPVFLSWAPSLMLVVDSLVMTISCIVAYVAKTFSWS
jgi:hypothetical protein